MCLLARMLFCFFGLVLCNSYSQPVKANAAVLLGTKINIGSQNKFIQLGVSVFGATNYKNVALESGFSVYTGYLWQRHTIYSKGIVKGYDVFYVLGYGQNHNLLGSSLSQYQKTVVHTNENSDSFRGIGFGFEKQYLPNTLQEFNQRKGRLMFRYSDHQSSYNLTFKNDLRLGNLFYGDATDFGDTGTLQLSYVKVGEMDEIHRFGMSLQLFTPKPDLLKIANNLINSDDGRKNVWHTIGRFKNVFYANMFAAYSYQNNFINYTTKLGIESNKVGAYVQNKLHDGFGLNPRYPWHVTQKNKLFVVVGMENFIIKN